MLGTIAAVALITLIIVAPVIGIAISKITKEYGNKEKLEHPERINLRR